MSKPPPWTDGQLAEARRALARTLGGRLQDYRRAAEAVEAAVYAAAPIDVPDPLQVLVMGRNQERTRVLLSQTIRSLNEAGETHSTAAIAADAAPLRAIRGAMYGRAYVELGVPADVVDAVRTMLAATGGDLVPVA